MNIGFCGNSLHNLNAVYINEFGKKCDNIKYKNKSRKFTDEEIEERKKQQNKIARAKYETKNKEGKQSRKERNKRYYQKKLDIKAQHDFEDKIQKEVHFRIIKVRFKLWANEIHYF